MRSRARFQGGRLAEKMLRCLDYILLVVCFAPLSSQIVTLPAQPQIARQLRGSVVFPDGTPAAEATVRASAICVDRSEGDVHIAQVRETTTAEDGRFSFPVFDPDCNRYSFSASKPTDYWLPSNENVFAGMSLTAPVVELSATMPSQPVEIVLRIRGGKVTFRVWDIATDRFVRARFELNHKPIKHKKFGAMLLSTGMDGSADTELLPPGEYTVEVESYPCGSEEYSTSSGPVSSFVVNPATQSEVIIRVDVRNIKPNPRYDGHRRRNCNP